MVAFSIVELDDGLTVVELPPGERPEEVAASYGGFLVDPGPYPSYEEACEALAEIPVSDEDERE